MAKKQKTEQAEIQAEQVEVQAEQPEVSVPETPPTESIPIQHEPRMPVVPPVHRYAGPMPPMPEQQKRNLDEYYKNPQAAPQINPTRKGGVTPR
jgi:hypothetical protein